MLLEWVEFTCTWSAGSVSLWFSCSGQCRWNSLGSCLEESLHCWVLASSILVPTVSSLCMRLCMLTLPRMCLLSQVWVHFCGSPFIPSMLFLLDNFCCKKLYHYNSCYRFSKDFSDWAVFIQFIDFLVCIHSSHYTWLKSQTFHHSTPTGLAWRSLQKDIRSNLHSFGSMLTAH